MHDLSYDEEHSIQSIAAREASPLVRDNYSCKEPIVYHWKWNYEELDSNEEIR